MKAWELLDQKGWCRGTYAVDAGGNSVSVGAETATAFCANGALLKVYPGYDDYFSAYDKLLKRVRPIAGTVPKWNDSQTSAEPVIALLKELDI